MGIPEDEHGVPQVEACPLVPPDDTGERLDEDADTGVAEGGGEEVGQRDRDVLGVGAR